MKQYDASSTRACAYLVASNANNGRKLPRDPRHPGREVEDCRSHTHPTASQKEVSASHSFAILPSLFNIAWTGAEREASVPPIRAVFAVAKLTSRAPAEFEAGTSWNKRVWMVRSAATPQTHIFFTLLFHNGSFHLSLYATKADTAQLQKAFSAKYN